MYDDTELGLGGRVSYSVEGNPYPDGNSAYPMKPVAYHAKQTVHSGTQMKVAPEHQKIDELETPINKYRRLNNQTVDPNQ